jgi:hypothetical protein
MARCALLASFAVLRSPGTAWAQSPDSAAQEPTAEDLIAKGIDLRKQGHDAEALATFERAYARQASPRAAAQIALAHHALAQWREAERGLFEALRNGDDPWVVRNRLYLEESLAVVQAHLAWLEVVSNVAGAEVWMDRELCGRLPLEQPLRIVAGEVAIEVRAAGYAAMNRTLQIAANSHMKAVFTFEMPEPAFSPRVSGETSPIPRAPVRRTTSATRTAGWITLGGAGVLALVGIGGAVTRELEAEIWSDDRCAPTPGQPSRYARCGTNRDIGMTAQTIAIAAFVGAGVAGAVSGILLLRSAGSTAASTTGPVQCRMAGTLLACDGAF